MCRKKNNKAKIPRKISLQTCFYFVKMYLEERTEIEKIKKGVHLMTVDEKLDFLIEGFTEMKLDIKELKEDVSVLKEDVSVLKEVVSVLKEDVSVLKEDVSVLKEDVSVLKEDVSGLKEDVSGLKEDVSVLKEDVSGLKEDVSVLKEDVLGLKEDVLGLKKDVSEIKVLQENEMWPAIKIIAEGHFGISRSLENYHKILKEQVAKNEVYDVYIKHLDTKIGELKKA